LSSPDSASLEIISAQGSEFYSDVMTCIGRVLGYFLLDPCG
jgi:hypothetical protein